MPKLKAEQFDGYWCTDDESHQQCRDDGELSAGPDMVESIKAVREVFGGRCRLEYLGAPRRKLVSEPPRDLSAKPDPEPEPEKQTIVKQGDLFGGKGHGRSKQSNHRRFSRKRS